MPDNGFYQNDEPPQDKVQLFLGCLMIVMLTTVFVVLVTHWSYQ